MDFFQHQTKAKNQTLLLVFLYSLGLLALTGLFNLWLMWNNAQTGTMIFWSIVLILGIVIVSLWKTSSLAKGGGHAVAETLGGRRVEPTMGNPIDQRLHNVVEEMALASGIPCLLSTLWTTRRASMPLPPAFPPMTQ